jgi:hypothetical protein
MASTQNIIDYGNIQVKNFDGNVGSYAVSTVNFNSWMNEPIVNPQQKTRKSRGVKETVNKIFSDCASIIQDPFWIDKFNNAAIGKFPQKFSFNDGVLIYRKGAKSHNVDISNNPYEACYAFMEFLRVNGGIFSPMDEQNSLNLQYSRAHAALTQQQLTWGDANKKVQECMLSHYVVTMKDVMGISDLELEQLRQTIKLGIANKYFGRHNISLENNRIHTIGGLLWNAETRMFYINPDIKPSVSRSYSRKKDGPPAIDPNHKDMIPSFGVKWEKYVESLNNKIIRSNRRKNRVNIQHQAGNVRHLQLITSTKESTTKTEIQTSDADIDDE